MNLNRAMIIGNLTRDPELRTIPTGQNVCNFSIATSSQWTDSAGQKQERTEYHTIVAWGKLADICGQYLAKGKKAYVEGRLQTRDWETQDGQKRQRTEIVCENMIILSPPSGSSSGSTGYSKPAPTYSHTIQQNTAPSTQKIDQGMGDNEIRIEDIPF